MARSIGQGSLSYIVLSDEDLKHAEVSEKELQIAERLVEAMIDRWDPNRYRDDYRVDLKQLIDGRVAAGQLRRSA